ncbi:MAG: RNase adapter RapZ [Acetobacteraceae bacterium]|nr:RNase adapter RapZ [Acetobacteraceae bacterium]
MSSVDRESRVRVVLVSGLSGAGKSSILHALEDLGYDAVDNPPLRLLESLIERSERPLALGVDARTEGFDASAVLDMMARLREAGVRPELVFAWAEEAALLRRYTETRRRHPLAPLGRVTDGIAREEWLTAELKEAADLLVDTSDLPLPALRQLIDRHYGTEAEATGPLGLSLMLVSFAFRSGLPREADLVFDARFLRNPHYDPILRPRTGLDPEVGAYVEADPDYHAFFGAITGLLSLVLPRFVEEGKKYTTIAIGCTGGRHRSVHLVESLARFLTDSGWRPSVTHRELAREGGSAADRRVPERDRAAERAERDEGGGARRSPVQAQEA